MEIKNYFQLLILCLIIVVGNVYSYEINVIYAGKSENSDIIHIGYVIGEYKILANNKDVSVKVHADITVKKDILNYSNRFTILFFPERLLTNPEVVTEVRYNRSSDKISKSGIFRKRDENPLDVRLVIPVNMSDFEFYNYKDYSITFTYLLRDYVFKQGDYYVVSLNFPNMGRNMDDSRLSNTLMLPEPTSIPYRFPEDVKSYTILSPVGNREFGNETWAFKFKGSKSRIFWYYDAEEINTKNLYKNISFLLLGLFLSFIASALTC